MENHGVRIKRVKNLSKQLYTTTKQKTIEFQREFRRQTIIAVSAAFGFLIALVWRDTIISIINRISPTPSPGKEILINLVSAVVITLISVLALMSLSKWNVNESIQEKTKEISAMS